MSALTHRVSIIGLGPKGLYCLERILAYYAASGLGSPLHIDVFNAGPGFGCSPIYDPSLPEFLLVNIKVGEVDLFEPQDPPIVAPGGRDFVTWYRSTHPQRDPLTGEEYLSRAAVGRYLIQGCQHILDHLPAGVTVSCHAAEVTDVEAAGAGFRITHQGPAGEESVRADRVMLATGHASPRLRGEARRWACFARDHPGATFVAGVYPVADLVDAVPPGSTVAMLGIGLTFIDGALALTQGRGGVFEDGGEAGLAYLPSGREPAKILPFSRSGLPMSPKAFDTGWNPQSLLFMTPDVLAEAQARSPGGRLDLARDIWPLIDSELQLRYLRTVLAGRPEAALLESASGHPGIFRQLLHQLACTNPAWHPLDIASVLDPAATQTFSSGAAFNRFVAGHMATEIARARLGQSRSGVRAAAEAWYEIRGALGALIARCGLDPDSHRRLAEEVFPAFKRVAFGPPVVNIEKLLALQRAGVVDFSLARNPAVVPDPAAPGFVLRSSLCPEELVRVTTLVDARYPAVDVQSDASPLYTALARRGTVRAFRNPPAATGDAYSTGAVDMTAGSQCLVGRDGSPNLGIAVIGIPTEGKLTGNFSLTRDPFAGVWAREVIDHFSRLECQEAGGRPTPARSRP